MLILDSAPRNISSLFGIAKKVQKCTSFDPSNSFDLRVGGSTYIECKYIDLGGDCRLFSGHFGSYWLG